MPTRKKPVPDGTTTAARKGATSKTKKSTEQWKKTPSAQRRKTAPKHKAMAPGSESKVEVLARNASDRLMAASEALLEGDAHRAAMLLGEINSYEDYGRTTKFRPWMVEQGFKLKLLGLSNAKVAELWGVSLDTLNEWLAASPSLASSFARAAEVADAEVVASMYLSAKGYSHPDVHITSSQGRLFKTPITKHYPPDSRAALLWLMNRQPDRYRPRRPIDAEGHDPQEIAEIARRALAAALAETPQSGGGE